MESKFKEAENKKAGKELKKEKEKEKEGVVVKKQKLPEMPQANEDKKGVK